MILSRLKREMNLVIPKLNEKNIFLMKSVLAMFLILIFFLIMEQIIFPIEVPANNDFDIFMDIMIA